MSESTEVVIRVYPDRMHAEMARAYLDSEGVESFVVERDMAGTVMGDGAPHELKVAEADLEAAEALLAETEVFDE